MQFHILVVIFALIVKIVLFFLQDDMLCGMCVRPRKVAARNPKFIFLVVI